MHSSHSRFLSLTICAGTFALVGALVSNQGAEAANIRGYAPGHFAFELDGATAGFIDKVSGGDVVGNLVSEKVTAVGAFQKKHIGGIKYEDITFSAGPGMSKPFLEWIKGSVTAAGSHVRKNGAILSADFDDKIVEKVTFNNAIISNVTFPTLEANGKEAAYMSVTISPEVTRRVAGGGTKLNVQTGAAKAKRWLPSAFRIKIPGLEEACTRVTKVEGLSVRFKHVENPVGELRDYEKSSAPADISNLVITVPEQFAASIYKWQDDFLVKGKNTDADEKTVTIEMLDQTLKDVLFTLTLKGVGLISVGAEKVESAETVRRVRAEMYIESLTFDYGAAAL
jgi:phage tail-like protein